MVLNYPLFYFLCIKKRHPTAGQSSVHVECGMCQIEELQNKRAMAL